MRERKREREREKERVKYIDKEKLDFFPCQPLLSSKLLFILGRIFSFLIFPFLNFSFYNISTKFSEYFSVIIFVSVLTETEHHSLLIVTCNFFYSISCLLPLLVFSYLPFFFFVLQFLFLVTLTSALSFILFSLHR